MNQPSSLLRFLRRIVRPGEDDTTDRQLLERFACGHDEAAFAALVERHGPMVFGVCRRVLHNAHDAEDAFQAAFLVLARKAGSLRRPEALGNWLYGVAHRTALEARSRDAKRRARERESAEKPTVDPNRDLVWGEIRAVLDREVSRLPDKYRAAFVLCYLEGRTNEEAARLLRCPKGTILSRLAWARQRLRDRLARRGVTLAAGAVAFLTADRLSAAVPAELIKATASAARGFVGGQAVASAEVTALAKGVLQAMFLDQFKLATMALLAAALLGVGLAWLGQPTWASGTREEADPAAPARTEQLLDTLLALEKRSWEASKRKDVARLREITAEDYVAILPEGSRLTRDEMFALLPLCDIKRYSLSDVRVLSLGPDAAVLLYQADSETVHWGKTWKEQTQFSSTWVRREGEWRNVLLQETPIEE
jgi:RNA polymerase sigma factor (sigma-70 family)